MSGLWSVLDTIKSSSSQLIEGTKKDIQEFSQQLKAETKQVLQDRKKKEQTEQHHSKSSTSTDKIDESNTNTTSLTNSSPSLANSTDSLPLGFSALTQNFEKLSNQMFSLLTPSLFGSESEVHSDNSLVSSQLSQQQQRQQTGIMNAAQRLAALRADRKTYTGSPTDEAYKAFAADFAADYANDAYKSQIAILLDSQPVMKQLFDELSSDAEPVPVSKVSVLQFWSHYFWRFLQYEREEERRTKLHSRLQQLSQQQPQQQSNNAAATQTSGENDDPFDWGSDDEKAEGSAALESAEESIASAAVARESEQRLNELRRRREIELMEEDRIEAEVKAKKQNENKSIENARQAAVDARVTSASTATATATAITTDTASDTATDTDTDTDTAVAAEATTTTTTSYSASPLSSIQSVVVSPPAAQGVKADNPTEDGSVTIRSQSHSPQSTASTDSHIKAPVLSIRPNDSHSHLVVDQSTPKSNSTSFTASRSDQSAISEPVIIEAADVQQIQTTQAQQVNDNKAATDDWSDWE